MICYLPRLPYHSDLEECPLAMAGTVCLPLKSCLNSFCKIRNWGFRGVFLRISSRIFINIKSSCYIAIDGTGANFGDQLWVFLQINLLISLGSFGLLGYVHTYGKQAQIACGIRVGKKKKRVFFFFSPPTTVSAIVLKIVAIYTMKPHFNLCCGCHN